MPRKAADVLRTSRTVAAPRRERDAHAEPLDLGRADPRAGARARAAGGAPPRAGAGAGAKPAGAGTPTQTQRAADGTPWALSRKSMYGPGGATLGDGGEAATTPPAVGRDGQLDVALVHVVGVGGRAGRHQHRAAHLAGRADRELGAVADRGRRRGDRRARRAAEQVGRREDLGDVVRRCRRTGSVSPPADTHARVRAAAGRSSGSPRPSPCEASGVQAFAAGL